MTKVQTLERFFSERNSSYSTKTTYWRSVNYFEKVNEIEITEALEIAETEEENNIRWKNTHLRDWLIAYREWCYNNYKKATAQLYLTAITTLFRHYDITVEKLPYYNTNRAEQSIPINPDELVDRDVLRLCIDTNNPLLKAIVLFMSSSGIARIDVLNLTIGDYLEATKEYHSHMDSVKYAIQDMEDLDVVPEWHLTRQKTGVQYFTFSSPESTRAINMYLLTRNETLSKSKPLFDIHPRYFNQLFKDTNDNLGLGLNGQYSRFAPHMLRRYHATQLIEAGISESKVDLLQGRKPQSIAYTSYIKIKPSKMKTEYIEALPFIVIEDIEAVKSELDITKQQLTKKTDEYEQLNASIQDIYNELNDMKKRQDIWDQL